MISSRFVKWCLAVFVLAALLVIGSLIPFDVKQDSSTVENIGLFPGAIFTQSPALYRQPPHGILLRFTTTTAPITLEFQPKRLAIEMDQFTPNSSMAVVEVLVTVPYPNRHIFVGTMPVNRLGVFEFRLPEDITNNFELVLRYKDTTPKMPDGPRIVVRAIRFT